MADIQESFTERIIRRASLRRHRDSNATLNSSNEVLQRRYNILRAINEPYSRRGSCIGINDSQRFDHSYDFSRDNFNLTEMSCNNNNDENSTDAYKKIDEDNKKSDSKYTKFFELGSANRSRPLNNQVYTRPSNLAQTEDQSRGNSLINVYNSDEKPAELPKIMAQKNAKENNSSDATFDINFFQVTESLKTSMLAAIDDSHAEIEQQIQRTSKNTFATEAVIEMCNRVYTALELDCESSDLHDFGIKNVTSPRNSKNMDDDASLYEKFVKRETEAPTLEFTGKLVNLSPRKMLLPTESHVALTIADPFASDQKYDGSEKWGELESTLNDTTTYDEDKFLVGALGDELFKMSVTDVDSYARDRTHSDFTASDLISEDDFPLQRRVMQAFNLQTSQPSSPRSSSTLNRSMRIYRSMSQRIKQKFRPALKTKKELQIAPTMPSGSEEIDMIQDLLQIVKAQQTVMNQAAKALQFCDTHKQFVRSSERVESERLLLLATLRRKAALEEIKGITSDEGSKTRASFREKAEITVSNISLDLRECLRPEPQDDEVLEWFVVAVAQGLNVWLTSAICCSTNESKLKFPESMTIPDLTPGFKIVVQVYSLRLRKANKNKSRIPRQSRSTSCLPYSNILASPTKLFKKLESPVSPTLQDQSNAWKSRNSSFVLSGCTELFLQDLSSSSSWTLMHVPTNSTLKGSIDLNLACRLHLAMSHEGFVNFYEEVGGFACWNRWWCVLKGHTLMFWNYPRERDIKKPLKIIELMACVSNEITTVDRSICPKPKTLLIETERSRIAGDRDSMIVECTSTSTFVRNLLSYDSAQELNGWSEKLNHVLLALEEWHIIGQRSHPQVSDL